VIGNLPHWLDDELVCSSWRQPKRLTVSQWADSHRVLEPLFASEPGPWRTDRAPYCREIMDAASRPWVRRITFMASTQVGKSEAMNNVAGYFIHQKPSPTMFVLPNRDAARLAAERRVLPMVQASDALSRELTDRSHDVKNREVVFRRSVLYMRSAQSPTDLASVPVRLVLCDEVDKWPAWAGREAEPLALVSERQRTFHDSLLFVSSTPTTRDGIIFREHQQGDQRSYYVPCPHCGEMQVLLFDNVRWPKDLRTGNEMRKARQAWYACAYCDERIEDQHKRDMLLAGMWVPEGRTPKEWEQQRDADREEHRSYHLWAAYSPWVSFWKIAAAFLDSKDDPARMMNFTNSWLARVWEQRVKATSDEAITRCIADYSVGHVPDEAVVLTAAVDVQVDYMVYMVVAWGHDEHSWVVECEMVSKWEDLALQLQRGFGPQALVPRLTVIDSRYRRDEVMEFSRATPGTRLIAGVQRDSLVPFATTRIDKHPRTGQVLRNGLTVWTVNVDMFKDLVSHRMQLALADGDEVPVGRLLLPKDMDPRWLRQMSAEHKIVKRSGNKQREMWQLKPGRQRNEAWDLLVYNAAAARMLGLDRVRSNAQPAPQRQKPRRRIMGAQRHDR
jgi:phage terminase large subunit GpA-like protein